MKTIKDAVKESYEHFKVIGEDNFSEEEMYILAFRDGRAFAEEFIPIKNEKPKVKHGTILLKFDDNPKRVVTGYVSKSNSKKVYPHWSHSSWETITHWRPINKNN